ncbi:MAG: ferric iron uptake transcriptional regulator [Agitococcus sp.]|jgi:Fur family ferric uptake transcriptional regulator|nr:ferric iron uptake transcriptional regulator [Moraxellaceae bacterium]MBP9215786.1 ferric iron uptake transcriptional regulator [Agitococcus sp.]MBK6757144.1 ferric iron uptake transcriptional regulator [Moraxellaceae bacterium]MBK7300495.1 ferric iron uptake transcriptional regulator [Moraxellaceae bacterium]MBK8327533.1 ferric iron uptake transcriptional regulator [Moraxellaceae bacterium]
MSFSNQDLRKAGLKVTLPRIKILELLENSTVHHLSAEDVYKALLEQGEDVGLATVYRVLTQFESAGIVERHHFEGGHSVFEISQGEHHDHIVCIMCNKVLEFNDEIIEAQQHKVAESLGFTLTDHALHLYGVCSATECQERAGGRKNFK